MRGRKASKRTDTLETPPRKSVLAIAAHPDDIEFMMAGTLLALRARGWEAHYFNVSNGDAGSTIETPAGTAKIRLLEAKASCRLGGFKHHPPIARDLGIAYEQRQIARTIAVVRAARPSIILTQSPQDYMFAEGWRKHNLLGFASDPTFDPLRDALADISVVDRKYSKWLDADY